jgi:hypothetical protein
MNYSEIQSLRLVIYACQDPALPVEPHWSGIAEVQAALKNGGLETYVVKSGSRHSTKGAAIEAAHQMVMKELISSSTMLPSKTGQPMHSPSDIYL